MAGVSTRAVENFHGIIAFIPNDSDFSLGSAVARLRKAFPRREVSRRGKQIGISAKRWALWLDYVTEPHVAEESQEMAKWNARHPLAAQIAICKRRVEFEGTHTETGTRCFSDLCRACEVMKEFRGVIVFDLEMKDTFC